MTVCPFLTICGHRCHITNTMKKRRPYFTKCFIFWSKREAKYRQILHSGRNGIMDLNEEQNPSTKELQKCVQNESTDSQILEKTTNLRISVATLLPECVGIYRAKSQSLPLRSHSKALLFCSSNHFSFTSIPVFISKIWYFIRCRSQQ